MPTANVYIDGFNLYYGALKGTKYKWLDLSAMCQKLLPNRTIGRIRYFTARITVLPHDPYGPARQNAYLRALSTLPNLTIHYGKFVARPQSAPVYPLTSPTPGSPPQLVTILRTEEKRSDVNLATLLMLDCVDDVFDEVVVISNDSDLTLPIDYSVRRFNKTAGVINPHRNGSPSGELSKVATWTYLTINPSVLANSQFNPVIQMGNSQVTKPSSW